MQRGGCMPVRTKANTSGLVLFALIIAGFFAAGFLVPSTLPSGEKSPLPLFMFMMGGVFLLINLALMVRGFIMNRRRLFIERNWTTAEAEVLSAEETGTYINRQPKIRYRFRVFPPGHQPVEVEHSMVTPLMALSHLAVGKRIKVKIDPADQSRIMPL